MQSYVVLELYMYGKGVYWALARPRRRACTESSANNAPRSLNTALASCSYPTRFRQSAVIGV